MRSVLVRAAAVLAVSCGAVFAAQGVAVADDHDHDPISVHLDNEVDNEPVDNDGILNGNVINVPIIAILDLDDIAILGVLDED